MPEQNVSLNLKLRDSETNEVVGSIDTMGTTEDGGQTIKVAAGMLPGAATAPIGDWTIQIVPPPIPVVPTAFVERIEDPENNVSTLVFQL